MKKCPDCKGKKICKTCKGTGQVRIVHSRNKGNSYERKIAKILSKWCGYEVNRTPSSGGWAKTGDITPKDPAKMVEFPFSVELKNRQNWSFGDLIKGTNENTGIVSWWQQCIDDAEKAKKVPLLIFTRNLDINYAIMDTGDHNKVGLWDLPSFEICIRKFISPIQIFDFNHLLKIDYEKAKRELNGRK